MRRLIAIFITCLLTQTGATTIRYADLDAQTAAKVDDFIISMPVLDFFHAISTRAKSPVSRETLVKSLIESHLVAKLAHEEEANGHDAHGHDNRVGYSAETQLENELFKMTRAAFGPELEAAMQQHRIKDPFDYLTTPLQLDKQRLQPALDMQNALHHEMTAQQAKLAATIELARYRFPGGEEQVLTLWDIYSRQNIQLKVQMHNYNIGFMENAVKQFLATQFVIHWLERESPLSAQDTATIRQLLAEREMQKAFMHEHGLMSDIHDENPVLRQLMSEVTANEVQAYYEGHRDEFQRVEKVRARHLRLDSQEKADAVHRELKAGLDFDEAVRRYSTAPDKAENPRGELGWITREDREASWLKGITFVQPPQTVSPPFRSPQSDDGVYWEIVYLDEKVIGYQPADSEGVRYVASQAIAQKRMVDNFVALKDGLWEKADIRINNQVRWSHQP